MVNFFMILPTIVSFKVTGSSLAETAFSTLMLECKCLKEVWFSITKFSENGWTGSPNYKLGILHLDHSDYLSDKSLIAVSSACPNIVKLNIHYCRLITVSVIHIFSF